MIEKTENPLKDNQNVSLEVQIDPVQFSHKPIGQEIGGIKKRLTNLDTIQEMTIADIAGALSSGQTIQPGITPFSEHSRQLGSKGTKDGDFAYQMLFMCDIDNQQQGIPLETPEHIANTLKANNLRACFMYETFGSTSDIPRFRFAVVCGEKITDRAERDKVQKALIAVSLQSDVECMNADRIFFGTNRGLIDSFSDFGAVFSKEELLTFANMVQTRHDAVIDPKNVIEGEIISEQTFIPEGQRNLTLSSKAFSLLKRYGPASTQAYSGFLRAAASCNPPLEPSELQTIWESAKKGYYEKILPDSTYIAPAEYNEVLQIESLRPKDFSDVGQANVFVEEYGNVVKYTNATRFLVYNNTVWAESELKAQGLSQELTERQLKEACDQITHSKKIIKEAKKAENEKEKQSAEKSLEDANEYLKYVLSRRKTDKIKATLTEARPKLEIQVSVLDQDGYLLNTPEGTVNLRTGEIMPHAAEDYCTKVTSVSPNTENADIFAAFMNRVTVGDKDLERYLQEVAGMCAIGKVLRENLIIAYGEGGNGKSTLFNLLAHVLGDYSGALSAETLTANCRKNKSPEYAELRGKRIVIAAELEEGMRLDTAIVKKLCSTDEILAEKKYKDPFTFVPSHTVILYTNHLPKIGTTDKGTWDRIIAVPFLANFRGMKGEIKNYAEYLYENCGGAVLSWIIDGAKRFIANGYELVLPEVVKKAIEQYKTNNDWLESFLAECCEIGRSYTEKSGELYARYKQYCDSTGDYRRSLADFKAALTGAGYETRKIKTGAFIYGLKIANRSDFAPCNDSSPWDSDEMTSR